MSVEKNLQELQKSCDTKMASQMSTFNSSKDPEDFDKTIVIRDLDHCKYNMDLQNISVKTLPAKLTRIDVPSCPIVTAGSATIARGGSSFSSFKDDKPSVIIDTRCDKDWEERTEFNAFSPENDIPDVTNNKVYDFEMSKTRTLPIKLTPEEVQKLKRKWLCIFSLAMSTVFVIIIVIVVLIHCT